MIKLPKNQSYRTLHKQGFLLPDTVKLKSSYEGARTGGRRLGAWQPTSGGPNSVLEYSLTELRRRSHQQHRDNGRANTARESFASNVVGRGIRPRWEMEDQDLKDEIHQLWDDSVLEMDADGIYDFYGQQWLVANALFESGEVLARRRLRRLADRLAVPLQLQLLEPDHFDEAKNLQGGNAVHMGIEIGPTGRRTAYHLYREHPGENAAHSIQSQRILAENIAHVFKAERPGQLRGVPWLTPIMVSLYELDKGEDAILVLYQVASMLTGFIKRDSGDETVEDLFPTSTDNQSWLDARDDYYSGMSGLAPGEMRVLAAGDSVEFSDLPNIGNNFQPWLKGTLRMIASAVGLTYEQLSGDMEGVNYSSARVALIEIRRRFEVVQRNILIHQFCRRVVAWWMDAAVASGALTIPDYNTNRRKYLRIDWRPHPFEFVDPVKDVTGDLLEIEAGLDSRDNKIIERGREPAVVDRERAEGQSRAEGVAITEDNETAQTARVAVLNSAIEGQS